MCYFYIGTYVVRGPGSSIGRAFDCQSNDPCRAVVRSPVRADIFSGLLSTQQWWVSDLFRLIEVKAARQVSSWPSGKLPFDCQKIAKNLTFFQKKNAKNYFFSKKLPMAIFLKKVKNFGHFFWKNVKFLAIFWQSNGNFPEGQVSSYFTMPYVYEDSGL